MATNDAPPPTTPPQGQSARPATPRAVSSTRPSVALPLGTVSELKGSSVLVNLSDDAARTVKPGEFLGVVGAQSVLLGAVESLGWSPHPTATLKLIASFTERDGAITPGQREIPSLGATVVRPQLNLIRAMLESRSSIHQRSSHEVSLALATARMYPDLPLSIPPEKLFGRHCAVVGSSGGGKSCSVARIIEQCAQYQSKVILLDPTGEYATLRGPVFHVHVGEPGPKKVSSSAATLPFYELTEADLVAIFEPDSSVQIAKMRAATRTLKLLHLEPRLGADGVFAKAHREKLHYEQAFNDLKLEIESPQNLFNIAHLPLQVELECVEPNRSHTETGFWGATNTDDISACASFISRVNEVLLRSEMEAIVAPPPGPSLFETIDSFLADPDFSVLRVSLEFLPTIHSTREIVCNAIARRLLAIGRSGRLTKTPTLLVIDEAHQVLRKSPSRFAREYPLDAFNIIAKEGRKYGLSLCIATQRPNDIPDDVMSQMGTFVVHRLASDSDRGSIERASGTAGEGVLNDLPNLGPGQAFILGLDFGLPLQVVMQLPDNPPLSQGPDYQNFWKPIGRDS